MKPLLEKIDVLILNKEEASFLQELIIKKKKKLLKL